MTIPETQARTGRNWLTRASKLPSPARPPAATATAVSAKALSLVQVQLHGLLGHRRPQPFDLPLRRLQRGLLAADTKPARHRRSHRIQRAPTGGPARVHHRRTLGPEGSVASRCMACPVNTDS